MKILIFYHYLTLLKNQKDKFLTILNNILFNRHNQKQCFSKII